MKKKTIILSIILILLVLLIGSYFLLSNKKYDYYVYAKGNSIVLTDSEFKRKTILLNDGDLEVVITKKQIYYKSSSEEVFNIITADLNKIFNGGGSNIYEEDVTKIGKYQDKLVYIKNDALYIEKELIDIAYDFYIDDYLYYFNKDSLIKLDKKFNKETINDNLNGKLGYVIEVRDGKVIYIVGNKLYIDNELVTDALNEYLGYESGSVVYEEYSINKEGKINYINSLNTDNIVVVTNPECSACKRYMPIIENVVKKYGIDINIIDSSKLTEEEIEKYNIECTPTTIINEAVFEGVITEDEIIMPIFILLEKEIETKKYQGSNNELLFKGESRVIGSYVVNNNDLYSLGDNKYIKLDDREKFIYDIVGNSIYFNVKNQNFKGTITLQGIVDSKQLLGEVTRVVNDYIIIEDNGYSLYKGNDFISKVDNMTLLVTEEDLYYIKDNKVYLNNIELTNGDDLFKIDETIFVTDNNVLKVIRNKKVIHEIENFNVHLGIVKY
jgi:thiol-disulfide isomerase/thioredoxin